MGSLPGTAQLESKAPDLSFWKRVESLANKTREAFSLAPNGSDPSRYRKPHRRGLEKQPTATTSRADTDVVLWEAPADAPPFADAAVEQLAQVSAEHSLPFNAS